MQSSSFYGGQEPREMPAYSMVEVAHYLQLPPSTLRTWVKGRLYPTETGQKFSCPLLTLPATPAGGPAALSFFNVVEAHVLRALRREHRVSMHKVREARNFLAEHFPSHHPLADQTGTGIPTAIIAERYKAGESIEDLARDDELPQRDIQEAIRRELEAKAA